jgi:calcium-dependent protein kinase
MYLVMENCPGGELFKRLTSQKDQMFNESEAATIMKRLFRAINHCHASGVVHRDIKAENIMYGADGEIKLIDFGLSRKINSKHSHMQTITGTPYYMAPEVLEGDYTQQCDVWSLGVLMYVLLCGYLPFQGENRNVVFHKI